MKLITKLKILELISGIFGWIWIFAGVVSIYFLVRAFFFDGEWLSFFIAIGVAVIGEWLARSFNEVKSNFWDEEKLKEENEKRTSV